MNKLDKIAGMYKVENEFDIVLMKHNFEIARKYFKGRDFLELGCATGESTIKLIPFARTVDVVEGSFNNISIAKKKIRKVGLSKNKQVIFYHSDWLKFNYGRNRYSDVIWFRGLEHIKEPDLLLKKIVQSLKPNGRLHIVTQNAFSLHRKIGTAMGLLKEPHQLNERDHKVGHFKVYDLNQIKHLIKKSRFKLISWHGIMLKPLPNKDMLKIYQENPKFVQGLYEVGKELPSLCAELYVCATLAKD